MTDAFARLAAALADRYSIERKLGEGGMATVYLARDLKHDRNVAIKVLKPELAAVLGAQRFLREIRIAAGLRHPHILPLYDSGEADGFLFYVMPYEEGQSLRTRLRKEGAFPVEDAVRILRDVADALAYAHGQGVVHRDIKPDNILLSGRHAMVMDFGVAKALSESAERSVVTTAGTALGTPTYMAPEQATADPTMDHRADVYAVGVLAYELLVGAPPFTGSDQVIIAAHVTQAPAEVAALRAAVPPALSALIGRCLEKRPGDRWQRLDDVLAELESLATLSGGIPPASRRRRWSRAGITGAVATFLVVVGGVAWWLSRAPGGAVTARVAVAPLENRTGIDSLSTLGAIAAEMITNGLTRAGLADVAPTQTVLAAGVVGGPGGSSTDNEAIVQETGATLLVSGTYSLRGDSTAFDAQLVDASRNRVLAPIDPVVVATKDQIKGIQRLGEHVAVVLSAQLHSPLSDVVAVSDMPMSMDAYRAYMTGVEEFLSGKLPDAIPDLRHAVTLDSTAAQPYLWLSLAVNQAGDRPLADSILQHVAPRVGSLPPFDRAGYDWIHAWFAGNREGALHAARQLAGMGWGVAGANAAVALNRLNEALADVESDLEKPSRRKSVYTWGWYVEVLYRKGEFDRALKAVHDAEGELGSRPALSSWEVSALAALGHASDLRKRLDSIRAVDPGNRLFQVAITLRVHGWTDAAADLGHDAIGWYREAVRASPTYLHRLRLANMTYRFGDPDEARTMFEALARDSTARDNSVAVGFLAFDAASRGATEVADSVIEELDRKAIPEASRRLLQARIAAHLGDCHRAVGFLRKGLQEGMPYPLDDPDLSLLKGCAEYDRFMAPKD